MGCSSESQINLTFGYSLSGNETYINGSFYRGYSTPLLDKTEEVLYKWVILFIAIFGIAGNLLNLAVLTNKSISKSMSRMEMSAHIGLVALALSDLLFCVVVVPRSFLPIESYVRHESVNFILVYDAYGDAVINIFETSSTWLTVSMAFSRYMAICHPFKARLFVGRTFARVNVCAVFVASILVNLPRFFSHVVGNACDAAGEYRYFKISSTLIADDVSHAYTWCHFIICVIVPFVCMAFCNIFLIKEVKAAPKKIQRQTSRDAKKSDSSMHLLTLTLTLIVVFYILLVTPAELNNFAVHVIDFERNNKMGRIYNFSVALTNTIKTLNFAINFTLYCAVNAHFRAVMKEMMCCKRKRCSESSPSAPQTEYSRVSAANERQLDVTHNSSGRRANFNQTSVV